MKAKEAIRILNEMCVEKDLTYNEILAVKYGVDCINRLCTIAEINSIIDSLKEIEDSIE